MAIAPVAPERGKGEADIGVAQRGSEATAVYRQPMGSPELWHAVHIGDEATISDLILGGLCNGVMSDLSGHSVFWHAIAFGHFGLAKMILDTFPPGSEFGVDVTEVHPKRGDTLLHLLCQTRPFGFEVAELFERIAAAVPHSVLEHANISGRSIFQIAAVSLNFWVLKDLCRKFPAFVKSTVCHQSAPLRMIADMVPQPAPPSFRMSVPLPEHFALASILTQDGSGVGRVPFADVAFDTGPPGSVANGECGRFLAHRVVVAAQSPVLLEELEKLPVQIFAAEMGHGTGTPCAVCRIDARISREVWRSVLQFMYSGVVYCPFKDDVNGVLELLRACVTYQLPRPLLDFVQVTLFQLLPISPPSVALEALELTTVVKGTCAGTSDAEELRPLRETVAHVLLSNAPQAFGAMEPAAVAQALELVLQTVEGCVFKAHQAEPPED